MNEWKSEIQNASVYVVWGMGKVQKVLLGLGTRRGKDQIGDAYFCMVKEVIDEYMKTTIWLGKDDRESRDDVAEEGWVEGRMHNFYVLIPIL